MSHSSGASTQPEASAAASPSAGRKTVGESWTFSGPGHEEAAVGGY